MFLSPISTLSDSWDVPDRGAGDLTCDLYNEQIWVELLCMVTMEGFRSWRLSPYQSKRPDFPAAGGSDTSNFFPKPEAEPSRTVSMVARFIFSPLACSRPARVSTGAEKRGIKLGRLVSATAIYQHL